MRKRRITTTGIATVAAAMLLSLGAGAANAATSDTCLGNGPASTLSAEEHNAFEAKMTALKKERNTIMAKYGKSAPAAGQGQRSGQKARGTGTKLTPQLRAEKRAVLAKWKDKRDTLFTEYGLTARTQGRST